MGRRANKPRVIPEQDQRICGSICVCQLTIVLSCVSIVYLSVAIYMPSYKAFKSGFEPDPVMCNTIDLAMPNNCPWASCGEWCLTKTSGFCPQIHSVVRRNGTDIQLNNCTRITTTACPQGIFYNPVSRSGFFAFRLRTVNRSLGNSRAAKDHSFQETETETEASETFDRLDEEAEKLKRLCPKSGTKEIFKLMRETVLMRQQPFSFEAFPRFLDTPGLIEFDFELRHGNKNYLTENWDSIKQKIIQLAADKKLQVYDEFTLEEEKFDEDVTTILLLTKLITTIGKRGFKEEKYRIFNFRQVDPENLKKVNCNNGLACATLNGVFNCSNGHCKNMSEFYLCHHKADGFTLDPDKDNTKLNGFFECSGARCTKIKNKFTCDRYCPKITTTAVNVLIIQDDSLITAECDTAVGFNEAREAEKGVQLDMPKQFWNETDGILLASCMGVIKDGDKIRAADCLNGTLLSQSTMPHPFMNFTQFWKIYAESDRILDPLQRFLPKQSTVTIYNSSKLYINLEGCVNTLRGECKEFVANYGKDGDNNTHVSRYQCYYNKVGDDAKMRCKYCSGENSDMEDNLPKSSSKKYLQKLNSSSTRSCRQNTDMRMGAAAATAGLIESSILDAHELATSTKSLLPISPLNETTEKTFSKSEANDGADKPLMII